MELRNRWPVMLAVLGVGWFAATSVTGLGMYMVACHADGTQHLLQVQQTAKRPTYSSRCVGHWTIGEGHLVLVVGSMLNMMLLAIMLVLLVHERRSHSFVQDPPPDYEMLIKGETPPPSFAEVQLCHQGDPVPIPCKAPCPCQPPYTPTKPEGTGTPSATTTLASSPCTMV